MTKKSKSLISSILTLGLIICLSLSVVWFSPLMAKAATTPEDGESVTTILMDEGASVRTEDYSGIRFTLYVSEAYLNGLTNPEVGIYIALADDVKGTLDMKSEAGVPENAMHYVAKAYAGDTEADDDILMFNAVISDIPSTEYGTRLTANGYIKEVGGTATFATNPQTRSVAEVASIALYNGLDDAVLYDYVDGVVTADNFKVEKTYVTTDDYKLTEPSLGAITTPENLKVIWESSNTAVATVNDNGAITRGGEYGTTNITAKLGSTTLTAVVDYNSEPYVVKVNENTYKDVYLSTGDAILTNFVANKDLPTALSDSYTGNAVKIGLATNANFRANNPYTVEELNNIAKDYTYVTMYLAVSGLTQGTAYLNSSDAVAAKTMWKEFSPVANTGFTTETDDKWNKVVIKTTEFISLLQSDTISNSFIQLFYNWNSNPNKESCWFISDIAFTNDKYPDVDHASISRVYLTKSEWETEISGDYTGNAVRFNYTTNVNNIVYANPYTEQELAQMKEDGITQVTLNIAFRVAPGKTFYLYGDAGGYDDYILGGQTNFNANNGNVNKWLKWTITIDQYITLVSAKNYEHFNPWVGSWHGGTAEEGSDGQYYYYFGDLVFS